jgi:SAM-dependent methyltransferase
VEPGHRGKEPSCRVTALDLPPVITTTRQAVEASGVTDRFEYLAGDLFQAELPEDAFDLAIVGNVCHLFSVGDDRRLLSRLIGTLRPGGTVALIDSLSGPGVSDQAIYALGLLLRAPEGDVDPLRRYTQWLLGTGYQMVEAAPLTSRPPLALVTARRPSRGSSPHLRPLKRQSPFRPNMETGWPLDTEPLRG